MIPPDSLFEGDLTDGLLVESDPVLWGLPPPSLPKGPHATSLSRVVATACRNAPDDLLPLSRALQLHLDCSTDSASSHSSRLSGSGSLGGVSPLECDVAWHPLMDPPPVDPPQWVLPLYEEPNAMEPSQALPLSTRPRTSHRYTRTAQVLAATELPTPRPRLPLHTLLASLKRLSAALPPLHPPTPTLVDLSPRLTDVKLPSIKLTTWRLDETPLVGQLGLKPDALLRPAHRRARRENRINALFLRMYAHDHSAKLRGLLWVPEYPSETPDESNTPLLPTCSQLCRLADMSKQKLWANLALEPRTDPLPPAPYDDNLRNRAEYHNKGMFMAKHRVERPWGVKHGKVCIQYTVKGWVNERWANHDL